MMDFLKELLVAVLCAAVPVVSGYAVAFIRKAGDHAAASTENVKVQTYTKEITKAITDAVAATNQTYVDAMKNSGYFDKAAQAKAAQLSMNACVDALRPAVKEFIIQGYGDLLEYLKPKIEAEVRKQKNEIAALAPLPVLEAGADGK